MMVRAVAISTATPVPTKNTVHVLGRVAPNETMTMSSGRSRKCVKVGRVSDRACWSVGLNCPVAMASLVRRSNRRK
jgi:hypothetical protein